MTIRNILKFVKEEKETTREPALNSYPFIPNAIPAMLLLPLGYICV
jgi:hypothetical protein